MIKRCAQGYNRSPLKQDVVLLKTGVENCNRRHDACHN